MTKIKCAVFIAHLIRTSAKAKLVRYYLKFGFSFHTVLANNFSKFNSIFHKKRFRVFILNSTHFSGIKENDIFENIIAKMNFHAFVKDIALSEISKEYSVLRFGSQ